MAAAAGLAYPFEEALRDAERGRIDLGRATALLEGSRAEENAQLLFATAAALRDERLGRTLTLTAHIHMITRCALSPACNYCSLSSSLPRVVAERDRMTAREVESAVRYAVRRGVRHFVLVGGTDPKGSDKAVRDLVDLLLAEFDVELAVDVGPSLSGRTVSWLNGRGVRPIYCSTETVDPGSFRDAKPGDDLASRLEFMKQVEREGAALGNVVMNGLGTRTDLLRSLLHCRAFHQLTHLNVSTFQPVPGTPWARRPRASVRDSLAAVAIARLLLPAVHTSLAEVGLEDPRGRGRNPTQLDAGAGNTLAAILCYKHQRFDELDRLRRTADLPGFEVS